MAGVLGLIATRSLTREVPGIEELVVESERRVRSGILAYTALTEIRRNPPGETHPALAAQFEENGRNLGYAYLLKRYVDNPADATPEQIQQAAWDTVPHVFPLFWAFRIMVGLGFFFIVLTATFFYLSSTHQLEKRRWLLWVAVWSIPLPWIAAELGWFVAEYGRQPWVIEGMLPTAYAVSSLGIGQVLFTLAGFALFYSVLAVVEVALLVKYIRKGPQPEGNLDSEGRERPASRTYSPAPAE